MKKERPKIFDFICSNLATKVVNPFELQKDLIIFIKR